jgi:hypothetical protein
VTRPAAQPVTRALVRQTSVSTASSPASVPTIGQIGGGIGNQKTRSPALFGDRLLKSSVCSSY